MSLLSDEDKKIYESEWSEIRNNLRDIFDENALNKNQIETLDNNEMSLSTKFALEEFDYLFSHELSGLLSEEDINHIKNELLFNDNKLDNSLIINEIDGHDSSYFLDGLNLSGIGKYIAAGLAALGTGIFALLVAGKDYLAIQKLKIFMNKVVEIIDMGTQKRKAWYSFMFSKKSQQNMGEYNNACFRNLQENAERSICDAVMNAAQQLGYFKKDNIMKITSGASPQTGSGLADFKKNVVDKLQIVD